MPKSEDELLERDAGRDIGSELLESLREMKGGEAATIHSPVAIARYRVKMSQSEFARLLGGASSPTADSGAAGSSPTPVILFAASPGTITGVMTIAAAHTPGRLPITALAAIAAVLAVTWMVMLLAARSAGHEQGIVHQVTTRFMGLIVLAMGVQFMLTGLKTFFT